MAGKLKSETRATNCNIYIIINYIKLRLLYILVLSIALRLLVILLLHICRIEILKVFRTEPAAPMPSEPLPLCQQLPALCHQLKGFQNVAVYTVFGVELKIGESGCVVYLYILYIAPRPFFRYPLGGGSPKRWWCMIDTPRSPPASLMACRAALPDCL